MTEQKSNPPPLRGAMLSGSIWMVGLRWSLRLLGAVNIAILARLLTPEDFGVVAMATAVVGLSKVFFELGVDYALIRKTDATEAHFNAAWSIRLLQTIALATTLIVLAPYAEAYYDDYRVVPILAVLALTVVVQGLGNIGVISFRRDLNFHLEFKFLVLSKLLSIVFTIALAFALRSYWALVIGILAANTIEAALGYVLHPFRPKLSFAAAGEIWSFSKWAIILQTSDYFALKVDRILLGGVVSADRLGHYTIGTEIAQMATTEIVAPVSRALVPGLAKLQADPKRLREAYLKTLAATALVTLPTAAGFALVANELVPIALGEQWFDAISIVQIASLYLMFATLASGAMNLTLVTGHISKLVGLSVVRSTLFLAAFFPAFDAGGVHGVLYLKTIVAALWLAGLFSLVSRLHGVAPRALLDQIWRPATGTALMSAALLYVTPLLIGPPILVLAMKIVIGVTVYAASSFLLWRWFGNKNDIESELAGLIVEKLAPRMKP